MPHRSLQMLLEVGGQRASEWTENGRDCDEKGGERKEEPDDDDDDDERK